jgi:hypothetical protein
MLVSDSVVKTAYGTMVQTTDLGDRVVKNIKVPTIPYIQNYSVQADNLKKMTEKIK